MCYHTSVKLKANDFIKVVNAPFPRQEEYLEFNHSRLVKMKNSSNIYAPMAKCQIKK